MTRARGAEEKACREEASVVRADGKHHHLDNLWVVDGSVFPSSLGVNPCETIYALAARNSTLLAESIAS